MIVPLSLFGLDIMKLASLLLLSQAIYVSLGHIMLIIGQYLDSTGVVFTWLSPVSFSYLACIYFWFSSTFSKEKSFIHIL